MLTERQHRREVGRRIAAIGLSRVGLARRAAVDPRTLRRFLNDGCNPTIRWLRAVYKAIEKAEKLASRAA